jgi:hypothetical protein
MVQVQALNAEGEAGGTGLKVFQHDRSEDPEGLRPPYDLDATATSANSIKLSWEGPSEGFFSVSCHPLTYDVPILLNRYVLCTLKIARCIKLLLFCSSKHSVLISNLKPYTTYELVVRMYDKNLNLGPSSQKIECQTLEDGECIFVIPNFCYSRINLN